MKFRCSLCGKKIDGKKAFEEHNQLIHNIDWDNLHDNEVADLLIQMDNCRTSLESWGIK